MRMAPVPKNGGVPPNRRDATHPTHHPFLDPLSTLSPSNSVSLSRDKLTSFSKSPLSIRHPPLIIGGRGDRDMVGGGSKKDDLPNRSSTNVFVALETPKKKSDKEHEKNKGSSKNQEKEPEQPVFWAPAPITSKKWADVEDEGNDDYYATTALLKDVWSLPGQQQAKEIVVALEEGA